MTEKSAIQTREEDAALINLKIEPDISRAYRQPTEDYLASMAISLRRIADALEAKAATVPVDPAVAPTMVPE
jgi:hypothetical protein